MPTASSSPPGELTEAHALELDRADPLRSFGEQFHIPTVPGTDRPVLYFCGNSLGLQPKSARTLVEQEMDDWARLGVDAHFKGATPWYSYHEVFRDCGARLVGARLPSSSSSVNEVVMMNSLTVNLHLMMVSFFQPTQSRFKILMDAPAFPSDMYAIETHVRSRGLDPSSAVIVAAPREGEHTLRTEDIEAILEREGSSIALVLLAGVNFFTGQAMDMHRITAAAKRHGCMVGWDLAHAAGNLQMHLHDWDVDFAVWCSYKYLNAGPGSIAGCFVHERHGRNVDLVRYAGWWGNDPATRFKMHLIPKFIPQPGAEGWQVSNPPILSAAPLRASLELFDRATMSQLRAKSLKLTGFLRSLLELMLPEGLKIITPIEEDAHGCQLSILVSDEPHKRFKALEEAGVVCDFREPNVIRIAPVPLYNTFHECWRFAHTLAGQVGGSGGVRGSAVKAHR
jgi:kynureninase